MIYHVRKEKLLAIGRWAGWRSRAFHQRWESGVTGFAPDSSDFLFVLLLGVTASDCHCGNLKHGFVGLLEVVHGVVLNITRGNNKMEGNKSCLRTLMPQEWVYSPESDLQAL
jgi:hypothetical protein